MKLTASIIGLVALLGFAGMLVYGYVENIIKLAAHVGLLDVLTVLRIIGIFVAPLGVILGFN